MKVETMDILNFRAFPLNGGIREVLWRVRANWPTVSEWFPLASVCPLTGQEFLGLLLLNQYFL